MFDGAAKTKLVLIVIDVECRCSTLRTISIDVVLTIPEIIVNSTLWPCLFIRGY